MIQKKGLGGLTKRSNGPPPNEQYPISNTFWPFRKYERVICALTSTIVIMI